MILSNNEIYLFVCFQHFNEALKKNRGKKFWKKTSICFKMFVLIFTLHLLWNKKNVLNLIFIKVIYCLRLTSLVICNSFFVFHLTSLRYRNTRFGTISRFNKLIKSFLFIFSNLNRLVANALFFTMFISNKD